MPLPDPVPPMVSAPRWAGVGLRADLILGWASRPPANWPADWWQRNYDEVYEYDAPGTWEMTDRMMNIPPAPAP